MQVRDLAAGRPIGLIACGFSPPDALAALADHLGWPGLFLSDEQRRLYSLLGMRRARLWQVYSPGTLTRYAIAAARGHRMPKPVEDIRQMGGDALLRDGIVVRRWLPRTPDDRARPAHLLNPRVLDADCGNPGPD
ncbi:MAG: AhpC/TSA family protein [Pseudonocardiaceae bacterium]